MPIHFSSRFLAISALALYFVSPISLIGSAEASPTKRAYNVDQVLGDGSSGNVFRQWRQDIPNQRVLSVVAEVRRVRGDSGTFLNLRYGDGKAFENGRQVFLRDDRFQTVSWSVNQQPNGQQLVLNAYKGEVLLRRVVVTYDSASSVVGKSERVGGSRRPDYRDKRDRYNNRYGDRDRDYRDRDYRDDDRYDDRRGGGDIARFCRRGNYRRPRIEVDKFKPSGGAFSGKYRLTGSLYGACVEEAGYFEKGRLKEQFKVPFSDRYKRTSFNLRVRSGKDGEIRVYSANGDEDIIYIDDLVRDNRRGGQQRQPQGGGLLDGLLN